MRSVPDPGDSESVQSLRTGDPVPIPDHEAIPSGPIEVLPALFVPRPAGRRLLRAALAGVALGAGDSALIERIVTFSDADAVITLVSWLHRVRAAETAR